MWQLEQMDAFVEFQSTHPCGVRPATSRTLRLCVWTFQSTHPCGVRPAFEGVS